MDFSGLLTFLGLMVAAYSVMPEKQRVIMVLELNWLDKIIVGLGGSTIVYIVYQPVIHAIGIDPFPFPFFLGFNSELVIVSCIIFLSLYAYSKQRKWYLATSFYSDLFSRSKKLFQSGQWTLLIELYAHYLPEILEKADWKYQAFHPGAQKKVTILEKIKRRVNSWRFRNGSPEGIVLDMLSETLVSKPFIEELVKKSPVMAAKLLEPDYRGNRGYAFVFFESLLKDNNSVLYRELSDCGGSPSVYSPKLPDSCEVLNSFLNDTEVAKRLNVFKPVGDFVINELRRLKKEPFDFFDKRENDVDEDELWESPIYAGMQFFKVMVSRALLTGQKYHMWLPYNALFLKRLVALQNENEWHDLSICSALTQECFSISEDWLRILWDQHTNTYFASFMEWGAIGYTAAIWHGYMLRDYVLSENISFEEKAAQFNWMLREQRGASPDGATAAVLRKVVEAIFESSENREAVFYAVKKTYAVMDHALKSESEVLGAKLRELDAEV